MSLPLSSKGTPDVNVNVNENLNPKLNDYERKRAQNIVRHNRQLLTLGLISAQEERRSNAAAWGLQLPEKNEGDNSSDGNKKNDDNQQENTTKLSKLNKRKPSKQQVTKEQPARKSARLQGIPAQEDTEIGDDDQVNNSSLNNGNLSEKERRLALVQECRQARLRLATRTMEEGEEKAAKENPTATYEHCLMRVRTMSEKKLINRVKAIERAAGKHCVVKMAIFKSCLQDEDQWDLANLASEALERLKALQPPPIDKSSGMQE